MVHLTPLPLSLSQRPTSPPLIISYLISIYFQSETLTNLRPQAWVPVQGGESVIHQWAHNHNTETQEFKGVRKLPRNYFLHGSLLWWSVPRLFKIRRMRTVPQWKMGFCCQVNSFPDILFCLLLLPFFPINQSPPPLQLPNSWLLPSCSGGSGHNNSQQKESSFTGEIPQNWTLRLAGTGDEQHCAFVSQNSSRQKVWI